MDIAQALVMNTLTLRGELRQKQTLSPRLQQAVRLLQLSSLDFNHEVSELLDRNPFLDTDEAGDAAAADRSDGVAATVRDHHDGGDDAAAHTQALDSDDSQAGEPLPEGASGLDTPPLENASDAPEPGDWNDLPEARQRNAEGGEASALDFVPEATTLAEHLHRQLGCMRLSERDLLLARTLIDSLDEDGYLRQPMDDLLPPLSDEPPVQDVEWRIALRHVQSLEPLGIGARTVQECLLLQLPSIVGAELQALATRIVCEELEGLAKRDLAGMARRLGATQNDVEAACARLRRLDPRPGWRVGGSRIQYVTPDVVVRKLRGRWTAMLNPSIVPRVRLNHTYADMLGRQPSPHAELSSHLQEARWLMRNVAQRFATIARVAQAIVDRQRQFFDYGPMAMKPLGLREIADELGMHESTVSRVTNNKYMATPGGVLELKHFFSRAMVSRNGSACSPTAIRDLVKQMIEHEQPQAPLSDAEIARQLASQGLDVARRTVTKYRQLMHLAPANRRTPA